MLPEISEEQYNIIKCMKTNKNVVVDSVAGSGKTTTTLFIANEFKYCNILHLTYNTKLKFDTKSKCNQMDFQNIHVHTYHSCCGYYYGNSCPTDVELLETIQKQMKPIKQMNIDIFIFDEIQDMTPLYYEFVCKIITDNNKKNTIYVLMGDKNQKIFDFNNAHTCYITHAYELMNFNNKPWEECTLSISRRLSINNANFVNYLLKENRIISVKECKIRPSYIIMDTYDEENDIPNIINIIYDKINKEKYKPDDIFVLSPSVKQNGKPINVFEKLIKERFNNKINIYVSTNEDQDLTEEHTKNKLVITTFHQAKGLERKIVFIYGFDDSYFQYYNKNADPIKCTNELYVATTRPTIELILIHHYERNSFQFVNINELESICNVIKFKELQIKKIILNSTKINKKATEMINHLSFELTNEIYSKLQIIQNSYYIQSKININKNINTYINDNEKIVESVSEINGIAIPAIYEYRHSNKCSVYSYYCMNRNSDYSTKSKSKSKFREFINYRNSDPRYQQFNILTKTSTTINLKVDDILYLSNYFRCHQDDYINKLYQIYYYDWLSNDVVDLCMERMKQLNISPNSKFEEMFHHTELYNHLNITLSASIDCIDIENKIIYEFKCVNQIQQCHFLQVAIYMYILQEKMYEQYNYRLYNILSNECWDISCNKEDLKYIMKTLYEYKFNQQNKLSDIEFILNQIKIKEKYMYI